MKLHRIRVSIRTQLMALVLIVALLSLAILAIVTGVYFTSVFTEDRAQRLEVIAQLKASQLEQSFQYLYYQVSLLRSKDTIENALSYRKAGNESSEAVDSALDTIQQLMDSSDIFNSARLYDIQYNVIGQVDNLEAAHNISENVLDSLYILSNDPPKNSQLEEKLGGPELSGGFSFMSITMAVMSNSSVLISSPNLAGYLSVVMNIDSLQSVTNVTGQSDYSTVDVLRPATPQDNYSDYLGFYYIFQPYHVATNVSLDLFNMSQYAPASDVFVDSKDSGSYTSLKNPFGQSVALGYSVATLESDTWLVTVEQSRHAFMGPTTKLTKIIIGVCFAIAIFMTLITFPLAHYGVRPIVLLQKATESMTERRGLISEKKGRKKRLSTGNRFSAFMTNSNSSNEKSASANNNHLPGHHNNSAYENTNNDSTSLEYRSPSPFREEDMSFSSQHTGYRQGSLSTHPSGINSFDGTDYQEIQPSILQRRGFFIDELNELTEAFNAMTSELDKQYTHLEDRVKERTKELEVAKIQADGARAQAEAANEAKTVFIANISHELRTPLNGILGMTAVAMAENSPENIQSSLDIIFRSGELLLHILTQLLTFSKNQLDKSKLESRQFQISEVASQVKSIFGKTAKDQKVNLSIVVKPDVFRKMIMFGDSNRLIQVIMNLVSNSLKFTPVNGSVAVYIKIIGEYDEEVSAKHNYDRAYVKKVKGEHSDDEEDEDDDGEENGEFIYEKVIDDIKSPLDKDDAASIHTLTSQIYKRVLAESYNFKGYTTTVDDDKELSPDLKSTNNFTSTETTVLPSSSSDESDPSSTEILDYRSGSNLDGLQSHSKRQKYHKFKLEKKWVLQIQVIDTGTGIDESLQDKVFEAFVQGDQTLSRSYGGTGLGLSICKQFSRMMHGTLTLKSKVGEDSGSTFTFTIPIPQVGELILTPEEEAEIHNDEFNEDYPRNKKVTFLDHTEVADSDGNYNDSIEDADDGEYEDDTESRSTSVMQKRRSSSKNGALEKPNSAAQFASSTATASPSAVSDEGLASYFDRPELITRMSTGTAHSVLRKSSTDTSLSYESTRNPVLSGLAGTRSSSVSTTATITSVADIKNNFRFLIAEDNLVNQEVIKRMLNLEGFHNITLACDGSEAIKILRDAEANTQTFDLIFMDVQMPNIDGLSATRIIRQELKYTNPIVALTAFADKSNEDDCIEAGMTGFLSKPVRRNLLKAIIQEYCNVNVTPGNRIPSAASSSRSTISNDDDSHQRRSVSRSNLFDEKIDE